MAPSCHPSTNDDVAFALCSGRDGRGGRWGTTRQRLHGLRHQRVGAVSLRQRPRPCVVGLLQEQRQTAHSEGGLADQADEATDDSIADQADHAVDDGTGDGVASWPKLRVALRILVTIACILCSVGIPLMLVVILFGQRNSSCRSAQDSKRVSILENETNEIESEDEATGAEEEATEVCT